jgi:hypothetical protein
MDITLCGVEGDKLIERGCGGARMMAVEFWCGSMEGSIGARRLAKLVTPSAPSSSSLDESLHLGTWIPERSRGAGA